MPDFILSVCLLLRPRPKMNQPASRRRSNEITVQFHIQARCPKCHKDTVRLATIEPHPTQDDLAVHSFNCTVCGPVRTKVISLRPAIEDAA
jgi:hypothetical protein